MKTRITLSQAFEGYLLAANARHLSPGTLADYKNTFRKFISFLDADPPMGDITSKQIESFLANQNVAKKTIMNYHIGLSALWTWAVGEKVVSEHIVRSVVRAKPERRSIKPYSEMDILSMIEAIAYSNLYTRPGKRESRHSLPHSERNRAIILLLLDTGIRASELCELKIFQTDLQNRRITVFGKGSKERTIPISARTGQAIWKYLATRKDESIGDYLFSTSGGRPMVRDELLKIIFRIAARAKVSGATVHRFRHTFAINYLRNGGDAFTLQLTLGHSTMEMVKTYLMLAQTDLELNHKRASPVDHWRL